MPQRSRRHHIRSRASACWAMQEADRPLPLFGEMGEQTRRCGPASGSPRSSSRGKSRSSRQAAIGHRYVHRQRRPQISPTAGAKRRADRCGGRRRLRSRPVRACRSARGSTGRCIGWPKPGTACRRARGLPAATVSMASSGVPPASTPPRLRPAACRSSPRGAEHHRAAAENAGSDAPLQRSGIGVIGHPRGDGRRGQPVLGDGDQQEIEKEALVLARFLSGHQEEEELGEGLPAHQIGDEITPPDLDPVGLGVAKRRSGYSGLSYQHASSPLATESSEYSTCCNIAWIVASPRVREPEAAAPVACRARPTARPGSRPPSAGRGRCPPRT